MSWSFSLQNVLFVASSCIIHVLKSCSLILTIVVVKCSSSIKKRNFIRWLQRLGKRWRCILYMVGQIGFHSHFFPAVFFRTYTSYQPLLFLVEWSYPTLNVRKLHKCNMGSSSFFFSKKDCTHRCSVAKNLTAFSRSLFKTSSERMGGERKKMRKWWIKLLCDLK